MLGHRMMAQNLGRGYVRKQEMFSLTNFAILSSIFSDTRPQQQQRDGSNSGADKGINTPFFEIVTTTNTLSHVKPSSKVYKNEP